MHVLWIQSLMRMAVQRLDRNTVTSECATGPCSGAIAKRDGP
jgi:hypothetical protein